MQVFVKKLKNANFAQKVIFFTFLLIRKKKANFFNSKNAITGRTVTKIRVHSVEHVSQVIGRTVFKKFGFIITFFWPKTKIGEKQHFF